MPTLESTDVKLVRHYLDQARERVLEVTTGLSDAQWHFKPAPDRWSIAENLEHLVLVQERVLGPIRARLAEAPAPARDRNVQEVDAIVVEKIPDRTITAKAPEFIQPKGQWPPTVALERLFRNHERLVEFVETTPDLRDHVLESVPLQIVTNGAFTIMDGYQFVLTVSRHDERHVRQILEVKADPNYPA